MHVHPHGISHFHTHTHLHTRSPRYFPPPLVARFRFRSSPRPLRRQSRRSNAHQLPHPSGCMHEDQMHHSSRWITTVHRSVIIVTCATISTSIYTTKDARGGCP